MRLCLLLLLSLWARPALADGTFRVGPVEWTVPRLRAALAPQIKTVYYHYRGVDHSAQCVPLWSVLAVPPGADKAGTVTVEGADIYRIVFSLGELSPQLGNEPVWLALDEDGAPLPPELAPTRLVIPGDVKLGRWVHNIERITLSP